MHSVTDKSKQRLISTTRWHIVGGSYNAGVLLVPAGELANNAANKILGVAEQHQRLV